MPEGPILSVVPGGAAGEGTLTVVGVLGDRLDALSAEARRALAGAAFVAGGRRHLEAWRAWVDAAAGRDAGARVVPVIEMGADAQGFAHHVAHLVVEDRRDVVVLASGDPGFFGILRSLLQVVDRDRIRVLPAPSSVAVAFARVGLPWDDAVVVSAHGRPLADAVGALRLARKAAVLTSPETPPQAVGRALLDAGLTMDLVAVCSRLESADEEVIELPLRELARGEFDPLSVVVLVGPGGLQALGWDSGTSHPPGAGGPEPAPAPAAGRTLAWGLPDQRFDHRHGMVTKAEVRAVVLGKLALPLVGVLWDVGAGSGSVAVECSRLCPGLTVFAIEQRAEDAARIAANAAALGASVHVVTGTAPDALEALPDPDRVFVGGGGLEVLEAALRRLRPEGRVVASYASVDRAAAAAERLGSLVQLGVARGERLPDGTVRLAAENPVFVCWGPTDEPDVAP